MKVRTLVEDRIPMAALGHAAQKSANVALRLTIVPDISQSFPVHDFDQTVRSHLRMQDGHIGRLNEIEWRKYSKYSADTTIKE